MMRTLNDEERKLLDRRVAEAEKRTGAQIVLAVIGRCDTYPELPWKAFALGASLAGLAAFGAQLRWPLASPALEALLSIVAIFAAGAGLALLCVFVPVFARFFLSRHRTEAETKQYAESLFLSRQLYAASGRRAVLVLIGLFERWIVVLPDTGLAAGLPAGATDQAIDAMRPLLKTGQLARALEAGLISLESLIPWEGSAAFPEQDLPNAVIEEKGA